MSEEHFKTVRHNPSQLHPLTALLFDDDNDKGPISDLGWQHVYILNIVTGDISKTKATIEMTVHEICELCDTYDMVMLGQHTASKFERKLFKTNRKKFDEIVSNRPQGAGHFTMHSFAPSLLKKQFPQLFYH